MRKTWMVGCMAMACILTSTMGSEVKAAGNDKVIAAELLTEENAPDAMIITQDEILTEDNQVSENELVTKEEDAENDFEEDQENGEENGPSEEDKEEDKEEEINQFEIDAKNWAKAQISNTYMTRAMTTTYQLNLKKIPLETSNYKISWTSSNKKVAAVDESGNVSAKKVGSAVIKCVVKTESGFTKEFTCQYTVSNPQFSKTTYVVAKKTMLQLKIKGTKTTDYKMTGNNEDLLKVYKKQLGLVRGKKVGKVTVSAQVDGITIQCDVVISNPKIKNSLYVLTKDQTGSIGVYNHSGLRKISYSSENPSVATVSSKGIITARKTGVAVICVTVDNAEFEITVSVGHSKAVSAIRYAQRALGATYSQMYRMRPGYYDCSSLIWRAYVPTGLTFGYSKYASNAPTAAGEAYYLVSRGKEISSRYVDEKYLQPGDVIFISSGYNGRYRNITHVVMYIGNDIIIHATPAGNNCVQYGSYSKYQNSIVSIGRPVM